MQVLIALFANFDAGDNQPHLVVAADAAGLLAKVKQSLKDNADGFKEAMQIDDTTIDAFLSLDEINDYLVELDNEDVIGDLFIYEYSETI